LVGHGIFHPRPDKPPFQPPQNFPGIHVPPHASMEPKVPTNEGWKKIVQQPVSHHRGWPTVSLRLPPPINPNVQFYPIILLVQSSHANKILKIDIPQPVQEKGKASASPSSPSTESVKSVSSHLHPKHDCSHVISEIQLQGSNQPRATQENSVGDSSEKRKYSSQSIKYGF
jgi:hypothetical protein